MAASTSGRSSSPVRRPPLELGFRNPNPSHTASVEERVGLLLRAAFKGYVPKIKKLVERLQEKARMSVDEAVRSIQAPWNKRHGPLHMAAVAGQMKACKYFIKDLKLDVNAAGTDGETPLVFAIHGIGSLAVVRLLLDHGANPDRTDIHGTYPLHIAAFRGDYELAELLLSRGAFVDVLWKCKSPLYIAARSGDARMVELLLHHNAHAGAPVNTGMPETPLIAAATAGLTDFIKCLLEADADANIADDYGRVAVEIAAIQGWQECVEVLFPVTAPLARVADWSIDGLLQHARFMSSQPQHPVLHEDNDYETEGDATFCRRDYSHAWTLYTMAMKIDPGNSTLYAKRSLCYLYTGHEAEAKKDATTYSPGYEEGEALILVMEYGSTCQAILPGLNPDV